MKKIYCGIFIFALAFQLINGQATLTVGPNGNYATIASALLVYQSGDIIQLEAQEYNGTDNRNFDFTGKNITIVGQGRLLTSINCEYFSRFAYVQADFVEKFFTFEGLTFKNCVINTGNVAYGGALYFKNNFTSLTLSDVGFENCQASKGGAIYAEGPLDDTEGHDVNIQIDNCYFGQNYANTTGGSLHIYSGNVSITNSMFTRNRANDAGCIFLDNYSYISIFNCTFTYNSAIQSAAAIYSQRYNTGTIASSTFSQNVATDSGAIYTSVTRFDIIGCTFFNNTAMYGEGGTFYFDASLVDMTDCYADTGYSGDMGGFGTIYNGGTLNYRGGSISNFEAYTAGALKVASDAKLNMYDTTISFCRGSGADGEAGAIYLIYRSKLLLVNTLLDSNSANANGGALWCGDSSINVTGTTSFNNNQAPSDNDIHCSTIISGTSCRVYGGDWQDFCAAVEPDNSFPVGYKILIGVVVGIAVVTVGGVLLFACYFKDRKKKRQEGQLWDHIQEDNKPASPNDD